MPRHWMPRRRRSMRERPCGGGCLARSGPLAGRLTSGRLSRAARGPISLRMKSNKPAYRPAGRRAGVVRLWIVHSARAERSSRSPLKDGRYNGWKNAVDRMPGNIDAPAVVTDAEVCHGRAAVARFDRRALPVGSGFVQRREMVPDPHPGPGEPAILAPIRCQGRRTAAAVLMSPDGSGRGMEILPGAN